ncbi:MAG TPA: TolC family protein [Longimicrobiales bacterium]|nr:TolC family protein [Longimicrobiales bacterium]
MRELLVAKISAYMNVLISGVFVFVFGAVAAPVSAQDPTAERPLGLEEAVSEALERNGDLRAARARTEGARAGIRGASAFLYPTVAADAGLTASDDPVAVFGTRLRQERFTEADFALDALNRPDPVSDWTAGVGGRWAIGDAAAWAGREAARMEAAAAELGLDRRREAVAFRTHVLYLAALASRAGAAAADTALEAARASLEAVRARREQGFLTDADLLQARAETAAARARRTDARRRALDARGRLGLHLGWSPDTLPRLTDDLLDGEPATEAVEGDEGPARADLRALDRAVAAADARARAASRSRLPALEAFGRLSSHAAGLTDDRTAHWSAGVQVRVPLFTGLAVGASVDRARAARRAAEAERRQRLLEARVEIREARRALEAAREGSAAADAANRSAAEARRLVRRRFQEGMATTADLLQADARAASMASRAVDARTELRLAAVRLDFARGTLLDHEPNDQGRILHD